MYVPVYVMEAALSSAYTALLASGRSDGFTVGTPVMSCATALLDRTAASRAVVVVNFILDVIGGRGEDIGLLSGSD